MTSEAGWCGARRCNFGECLCAGSVDEREAWEERLAGEKRCVTRNDSRTGVATRVLHGVGDACDINRRCKRD
jgi:hypothetical protein